MTFLLAELVGEGGGASKTLRTMIRASVGAPVGSFMLRAECVVQLLAVHVGYKLIATHAPLYTINNCHTHLHTLVAAHAFMR